MWVGFGIVHSRIESLQVQALEFRVYTWTLDLDLDLDLDLNFGFGLTRTWTWIVTTYIILGGILMDLL